MPVCNYDYARIMDAVHPRTSVAQVLRKLHWNRRSTQMHGAFQVVGRCNPDHSETQLTVRGRHETVSESASIWGLISWQPREIHLPALISTTDDLPHDNGIRFLFQISSSKVVSDFIKEIQHSLKITEVTSNLTAAFPSSADRMMNYTLSSIWESNDCPNIRIFRRRNIHVRAWQLQYFLKCPVQPSSPSCLSFYWSESATVGVAYGF